MAEHLKSEPRSNDSDPLFQLHEYSNAGREVERRELVRRVAAWGMNDAERLSWAFTFLTGRERQLLVAALAGNHPSGLAHLRTPVLRGLVRADHDA